MEKKLLFPNVLCDFSALLSLCMDYNLIYQFSTLNPKFFRLQFLKSVCQYFWLKVTKTQKIVTQNFSYDKTWFPVKLKILKVAKFEQKVTKT